MNELQNSGAHNLPSDKTLTLKIFSESDRLLKSVNIKTGLSIDELVRAIDVNLYKSSLDSDVLNMINSKIDPLVKLGNESFDLLPVLAEAMRALKEAQKENQENSEIIQQLKKQYLELRSMVLENENDNESEGLNNG